MNKPAQIILRVLPIIVVATIGYFGFQHWQKPLPSNQKPHPPKNTKIKSKKRSNRPNKRSVTTKALALKPTTYQIQLETQGIVSPTNVTVLTSEVNGKVTQIGQNFKKGAFVQKGEILLTLDQVDYDAAILSAEASLARSHANLAQEVARGEQALRNWKDIGFDEKPNDLVLRKPQLKEAQANVKSMQATLARALRNKERCTIRAPFSGVVRSRLVSLASSVSGNTKLGELLETRIAEVRLPLTAHQLDKLNQASNQLPTVTFTDALQANSKKTWSGQIVRREGEMDMASKELYLIAQINDPFNLKGKHSNALSFNQPLLAKIPALTLQNVVLINRKHVQGARDIISIIDNKIRLLKVNPIWEDQDCLIVPADSLPKGLLLATTPLPYAADGAPVTISNEPEMRKIEKLSNKKGK